MNKLAGFIVILLTLCCSLTACGLPEAFKDDELYNAVISGNLERVKEAVENGADVDKSYALYALHEIPMLYSIHNGQRHIPEYLLSAGANPNYIDKYNGVSILMYAVGARVSGVNYSNSTDNGYMYLLNDSRTDVNLTGRLGYTALDYVCRDNGRLEIVNDLINHGAAVSAITMDNALEGYKNRRCEEAVVKLIYDSLTEQKIPFTIAPDIEAAIRGDAVELISLAKSGKIGQDNKQIVMFLTCAFGNAEAFRALTDKDTDFDSNFAGYDYWGKTFLGISAAYGNIEIIAYLISEQANIEIMSEELFTHQEKTPLTFALQNNHPAVANYLYEHSATLQIAELGTSGGRPDSLEIACENGNLDTVKWVIEHGYPLDEERVELSMSEAALNGHIDLLRYFLDDLKVDINSESYHSTVLSAAKDVEIMKFLLDNGADVNGGKSCTVTPIDRAVMNNRADLVLMLLDNGADADFVGTDGGYTPLRPLTVAIQKGYFDIVKILVDSGVELDYHEGWDSGEDTPLQIAEAEKSQHIIDYIKNAVGK